jgi:anti-sigma B factor antagonist
MDGTTQGFSCHGQWIGDSSAVVTLEGELDLSTAVQLRECLRGLHERGITDHLVVDLSGCTFIDSTGLGLLVEAQMRAESPLNVVATERQILQALSVTALDSLFVIHETREAALAALRREVGEL